MRAGAVVALAGLLAACGGELSRAEAEKQCVAALKARTDGDEGKPGACEPLPAKAYDELLMGVVLDDLGWTGEDGEFDKNKMLEDVLEDQP